MFLAEPDISFAQRISRYPSLKNRIGLLMNVIEDCAGDCHKANEAEMRVIEELRQMGSEVLHSLTEHHARQLHQAQELITGQAKVEGCSLLIGEIDGSMIPIAKGG